MKKFKLILFAAVLLLVTVGCSSTTDSASEDGVILIVNGNLGDLGFFDSANEGMKCVEKDLGLPIQVIETGSDESKWEPALADAAEEKAKIIIAVSPSMVDPIQQIAPQYPDKTFILIDNAVDYSKGNLDNVYSATFKQNEGSFLAGALGAYMTTELPNADENSMIGFLGGMDIPPINDFLVGYIEGAKYVNEDIKVVATYAGDYYDPAKGKELGIALANKGVDVIFPAAGPTGLGTIEAARETNKYIIGVDSDQSAMYSNNNKQDIADIIISSMVKRVGDVLFNSVKLHQEDKLPLGTAEQLGVKEGAVGLAKNDVFTSSMKPETIAALEEIEQKIVAGEIEVSTAIGMSTEILNSIKTSVAP